MQQCSLLIGAPTGTVGFQNSTTLFLALKICNYSKVYFKSGSSLYRPFCLRNPFLTFPMSSSLLSGKNIKLKSLSHKKKLNSECTGLEFVLALLAVFAPVGFPLLYLAAM